MLTGNIHSIGGNRGNLTVVFHHSTLSSCLVVTELLKPDSGMHHPLQLTNEQFMLLLQVFSQTTETTLFPDKDGFIQQRTQYRPYIPEGYESYRAAGYRASQNGDYGEGYFLL